MRSLFLSVVMIALCTPLAQADLIVNLTEVGAGQVQISWSGMGVINGDDTTGAFQLHFDGLTGTPFNAGIASGGGSSFSLSSDLELAGTDASDSNSPYLNTYGTVTLINNPGTNNFRLEGGPGTVGLGDGDTYDVSGTALVNALSFADLNVGTYSSASPDASLFGSVTLVISSVPEPSAFLFGTVVCLAGSLRRRRR